MKSAAIASAALSGNRIRADRAACRAISGCHARPPQFHYIANDNPSAAERWFRELDDLFRLLARFPQLGQLMKVRRRTVRRTSFGNYVIYHRPADDGVEIVRDFHGAQDHERTLRKTWE